MADVEFTRDGHVAHVRLNRPQGLNAITQEMDDLLLDAWNAINADPDIWVAVLSAEGEKGFCIGADVSGGAERKTRMALGGGLTGIGGPLVTLDGKVIGIDTAASSNYTFSTSASEGFAIPIDRAISIANQIRSGAPSPSIHIGDTAFIGVGIADAPALGGPAGAVVRQVLADTPAGQVGLRAGDLITAVDGTPVTTAADLSNIVDGHRPGDTVTLTWIDRIGNHRSAPVVLGKGPVG